MWSLRKNPAERQFGVSHEKPRIKGDPPSLGQFFSLKAADQTSGSSKGKAKDEQQSKASYIFILSQNQYLHCRNYGLFSKECVIINK
jgi:hypothetical protein